MQDAFEGNVFVLRPGIMVGPRDPTDRFTWWPLRFARALSEGNDSAEVLAPGEPDRTVQYTDARDLAAWTVRMLDSGHGGTYNGVGPGREEMLREVLAECLRATQNEVGSGDVEEVRFEWASENLLREQLAKVPEEERPLWFPEDQIPFARVDSSRAIEAGLEFRPAYETARNTLAWRRSQGGELLAGFSTDFERHLLEKRRDQTP